MSIAADVKGVGLAVAVALAISVDPAAAAVPNNPLSMLASLAKGSWRIRLHDDSSQTRICMRNGAEFLQLRHLGMACRRYVLKDAMDEVVVHYTCRGHGFGRTTIRRESSELVQLESRGFRDGRPFSFSGEARRAGRC